mmetsp:Transcript_30088/g.84781  ORF Transcript_30088/g.84781 Transcript_30088/m.84781 type:complete len:274 (-) Transcript_30088:627-1448(-)
MTPSPLTSQERNLSMIISLNDSKEEGGSGDCCVCERICSKKQSSWNMGNSTVAFSAPTTSLACCSSSFPQGFKTSLCTVSISSSDTCSRKYLRNLSIFPAIVSSQSFRFAALCRSGLFDASISSGSLSPEKLAQSSTHPHALPSRPSSSPEPSFTNSIVFSFTENSDKSRPRPYLSLQSRIESLRNVQCSIWRTVGLKSSSLLSILRTSAFRSLEYMASSAGMSSMTILAARMARLSASNGCCRVAISKSTMPRLQTSLLNRYGLSWMISGLR